MILQSSSGFWRILLMYSPLLFLQPMSVIPAFSQKVAVHRWTLSCWELPNFSAEAGEGWTSEWLTEWRFLVYIKTDLAWERWGEIVSTPFLETSSILDGDGFERAPYGFRAVFPLRIMFLFKDFIYQILCWDCSTAVFVLCFSLFEIGRTAP